MASRKRKNLLPRRRRHDDEGEEDGSTAGDLNHYASSDASLGSDPEGEGDVSDHSAEGAHTASSTRSPVLSKQNPPAQAVGAAPMFQTTADTEAMLHGLQLQDGDVVEELVYEDTVPVVSMKQKTRTQPPRSKSNVTLPNKSSEGGNQLPAQPRAGYFLHDDRNSSQSTPSGSRGRGRGFPTSQRGAFGASANDTSKNWVHDLHDSINAPATTPQAAQAPKSAAPPLQPAAVAATAPNRSFSTTTVLGNVPVNVSMPGVEKKISASMVKKHYTLLPQHRPPLRRDKPVRISIPDEHPRYIFPSVERSFIFIPRAMRPNQQQFRPRGRGSFQGSRRPSMFGGSVYTPSIGMSRRPSIAGSVAGSGVQTPTSGAFGQYTAAMQKPIVRMPTLPGSLFVSTPQNAEVYMGDNSAIIHSPPATLPMHQPTPHKAVSVEQIEPPAMMIPQQQPQQPFHQQIPPDLQNSQGQHKMPHIPEGAVYAQPFQPYPAFQQQPYFGMSYPMQAVGMNYNYNPSMGGPVQESGGEGQPHPLSGPVAHATNGMVYYYDPSQQYLPPQMMMGMNMMPTGSGGYYYPPVHNQMFYQ